MNEWRYQLLEPWSVRNVSILIQNPENSFTRSRVHEVVVSMSIEQCSFVIAGRLRKVMFSQACVFPRGGGLGISGTRSFLGRVGMSKGMSRRALPTPLTHTWVVFTHPGHGTWDTTLYSAKRVVPILLECFLLWQIKLATHSVVIGHPLNLSISSTYHNIHSLLWYTHLYCVYVFSKMLDLVTI